MHYYFASQLVCSNFDRYALRAAAEGVDDPDVQREALGAVLASFQLIPSQKAFNSCAFFFVFRCYLFLLSLFTYVLCVSNVAAPTTLIKPAFRPCKLQVAIFMNIQIVFNSCVLFFLLSFF